MCVFGRGLPTRSWNIPVGDPWSRLSLARHPADLFSRFAVRLPSSAPLWYLRLAAFAVAPARSVCARLSFVGYSDESAATQCLGTINYHQQTRNYHRTDSPPFLPGLW